MIKAIKKYFRKREYIKINKKLNKMLNELTQEERTKVFDNVYKELEMAHQKFVEEIRK